MDIALDEVALGTGLAAAVPTLSLTASAGVPTVIAVETDERPMIVSLLLAGRIKPDAGRILVDGHEGMDELRRRTALIDTPVVAEPPAGVSLTSVIAEELAFSSISAGRKTVRLFLETHDLLDYAKVPLRALPGADRIRALCELALLRPQVNGLIVTSPERHGGEPAAWYEYLAELAAAGITVVIVTDCVTRDTLLSLGARDARIPESKADAS